MYKIHPQLIQLVGMAERIDVERRGPILSLLKFPQDWCYCSTAIFAPWG